MRRFYFDTETSAPDSVCNDHCGNIRGARTIAQKLANELNEVVYINDCETNDIVESVFPDSVENTEPEIVSEDFENKIPLESMEVAHIIVLLESENFSLNNHIELLKRPSFKNTSSIISGHKKRIASNNILIDKLNSLLLFLFGGTEK